MLDPKLLTVLSETGGWVAFAGLCIYGMWLIVTGRMVPGLSHKREIERGDALDAAVDKLTEAAKEQTAAMRTLLALTERDRA